MDRSHSSDPYCRGLAMKSSVLVQPPSHAVVIEHESIQTLFLSSEIVTTVVEVPGVQGPPGPPGDAFTVVFTQGSPALVWIIEHNLGRYPSVTVVDTANDQIIGDVSYPDANSAQVTFGAPTAGSAYLN